MITYFKDRNHKSKRKYKNFKTLSIIIESVDTIVIIGATSTSITPSITSIGLHVLPKSAGIVSAISLGNKILDKLVINKYNRYKNYNEKDQQKTKSVHKLYRKS